MSSTPSKGKGGRLDVDLDKMGEGFMSSMKAVGNSVSKVGEGIVDVTKKVGDGVVDGAKKVGDGVVDGAKKVGDGAKDLGSKVVEPLKASPRMPSTPAFMHAPTVLRDDFWKGTACLVIGGAGNLGGHIVQLLLERGARVASFDLVAYSGEGTDVASFVGSVTDRAALEAAMEGVGVVVHTASIIDLRPIPSLRMQQVNVAGTYEVVGACKVCGVHTLVYTSSLEVVSGFDEHGVHHELDGVDETAPIPPRHHLPYAATKAAAERRVPGSEQSSRYSAHDGAPLRPRARFARWRALSRSPQGRSSHGRAFSTTHGPHVRRAPYFPAHAGSCWRRTRRAGCAPSRSARATSSAPTTSASASRWRARTTGAATT